MMHFCSGTIGEINFLSSTETEFTKKLTANIPGISPEDVRFEQMEFTPYDEIVHLKILCDTRLNEGEYISYACVMDIDLREFYGFDYRVCDGRLYLTLYKEKKKDIHQLGYCFRFTTKYPKEQHQWV